VALPTGVAYAATKAAIAQMSRTLALEWGARGIRVNCIAPWYFPTPLTAGVLAQPEFLARVLRATPLGRIGDLDELLGAALFLASRASGYVTGHTLVVDGGMTTHGLPMSG
jgi:NAD(P)-dependent dehydrogenase (short-subunit alcohol dehydrogenase family)